MAFPVPLPKPKNEPVRRGPVEPVHGKPVRRGPVER
jgi:hypothetical protein